MDLSNEFTVPVPVERAWEVLTDVELIAPCLPGAQLQEIEGNEYRGIVKVKVGPITAEYKGAATFLEQDVANRRIVLEAAGRDTRGQGSASAVITATMTETGSGDGVSTHVVVDSDVTIKGKVAQFGRGMIAEVSAKLLTQFVECLEGKLEAEPTSAVAAPAEEPSAAAEPEVAPQASPAPEPEPTPEPVSDVGAPEPTPEPEPAVPAEPAPTTPTEPAPTPVAAEPAPEAAAPVEAAPTVRKIDHAPNEAVDLLGTAGAPLAKRLVPAAVGFFVLLLIGRFRAGRRRRS
jgi:carbon monoxide dehydrogenase subunit G